MKLCRWQHGGCLPQTTCLIRTETKPFSHIWRKSHGCRRSYSWGNFNHPDICFEARSTGHKHCRRALDWIGDNFLTQVLDKPTRGGALLDLLLPRRNNWLEMWRLRAALAAATMRWRSLPSWEKQARPGLQESRFWLVQGSARRILWDSGDPWRTKGLREAGCTKGQPLQNQGEWSDQCTESWACLQEASRLKQGIPDWPQMQRGRARRCEQGCVRDGLSSQNSTMVPMKLGKSKLHWNWT